MKAKVFKKALAILLAVMLVIPSMGLTSVISNADYQPGYSASDAALIVLNYPSLTAEEVAVLETGLVVGETHTYGLPDNNGSDLIEVDTSNKIVIAQGFSSNGLTWTPVSATLYYDEGSEDIAINGGSGSYDYEGGAFAVHVTYTADGFEVDAAMQDRLLNGPARLAKGVANLTAFANEYPVYDTLTDNIGMFVAMTDGSMPATLQSADTTAAITALAAEVANSEDECLEILSRALDFTDSASKVEYLLNEGLNFKEVAVRTYGYIKTIVEDAEIADFIETLQGAEKTRIQTVMNYLNSFLTNVEDAATDSWAIVDPTANYNPLKSGLTDEEYSTVDYFVSAINDPAEHDDALLAKLVPNEYIASKNVNQYNVTVTVKAYVAGAADSFEYTALEDHITVLKAYEHASAQEVLDEIISSGIETAALEAWDLNEVISNYDRNVETDINTNSSIEGDVYYNIVFTPKNVSLYTDYDGSTTVPYGFKYTLPEHEGDEDVYDYVVNGVDHLQGDVVTITGETTITRTEGKAWNIRKLNPIVAVNYDDTLTDDEKAVLNSVAVDSRIIRVRTPENSDDLITVVPHGEGFVVNGADFASGIEGLSWTAVSGKVYAAGVEVASFEFINGAAEFATDAAFDSITVDYQLTLTNVSVDEINSALNVPDVLASEAGAQIGALDDLNSYYGKLAELDKKTVNQIYVGVRGSDMSEESEAAVNNIINSCFDRSAGELFLLGHLDGYRAEGLAYYYKNDAAMRNQVDILLENLLVIENDPGLHQLLVDIDYAQYEQKIIDIIDKLTAVQAGLVAPNAMINLASPSVTELADALTALVNNGRTIYADGLLTLNTVLNAPVPGYAVVNLTVNEANSDGVVTKTATDTAIVSTDNPLTAADIEALNDKIDALVAELGIDAVHYATSDDLGLSAGTTVAGNVAKTFTYAPKTYIATIHQNNNIAYYQSFPFDAPTITLCNPEETGRAYVYTVDGADITVGDVSKTYTFTAAQIDAQVYENITRTVVDVTLDNFQTLVDNLNKAVAKAGLVNGSGNLTLAFIPMEDTNGDLVLLLRVSPKNFSLLDEAAVNIAEELSGSDFKYITLDGEYLREDATFSAQAVVDAILNSGLTLDTVLGMIDPDGDIIESTLTGCTVIGADANGVIPVSAGKQINDTDVVGGIFYDTDMTFSTTEASDDVLNVKLYVSLEDFDQSADDLKSARKLAVKLRNHGQITLHDGTVDVNAILPERAYQAYLASMLVLYEGGLDTVPYNQIDRT
ncbi:MAG: hypothetical protein IJR90_03395, partial [Clostridia bacterium]|nr:hypothetical protein [Clostridia bacterium]